MHQKNHQKTKSEVPSFKVTKSQQPLTENIALASCVKDLKKISGARKNVLKNGPI
jgi:hypothetical protein